MEKKGLDREIHERLESAFTPSRLEVVNDSARHSGHLGDDGTGETHFNVVIRAPAFADQSRIQRHRSVHAALGEEIISRVHALALDIDA